ncbi:unnamed protein product, partial [Rotaria sordida]
KKQHRLIAFISLAAHNRKGCEIAWKYMQDNWNKTEKIYDEHSRDLIHLVENVPCHFVNEQRANEVRNFYANHPNPIFEGTIGKVLQQINIRQLVLQHHENS